MKSQPEDGFIPAIDQLELQPGPGVISSSSALAAPTDIAHLPADDSAGIVRRYPTEGQSVQLKASRFPADVQQEPD